MQKLMFFILLGVLFFTTCKVDYSDPESEKIVREAKNHVEVAPVTESTDPIPIHGIGQLASDQEMKLSFKIGGIISSIKADEGDYVRAGKTLATMRTNEIDAQVLKAERALQKAERDLDRTKKMYADSAATMENVQDLTTLVQVAKADLDIASFNQKFAKIVSPVSGRIIRRLAEPNELVSPGQPVFLIAASSGKTHVMKVALSDRDINRIDYKSQAKVFFDAFPYDVFSGAVVNIAENSDPMTGTFEVELSIDAQKKRLRNGFIGRVEIATVQEEEYLKVPMSAIVEGEEDYLSVFVPVDSDTIARLIQVKPLHITSESVFVQKPDRFNMNTVITAGAPYLVNGDRIYIKENTNPIEKGAVSQR